MNNRARRVVAHIHESFFIGSETFIHHYISNHRRYDPICLAGSFINLDRFSFPKKDRYRIGTKFYGCDISRMTRTKKWKTLYSDLFQSGDLFLVEGPYMKAQLAEIGCPESKIRIQRIAIPVLRMRGHSHLPL